MAAGYRSSKIGQTSRNDGAQIPRSVDTDLHPCPSAVITRVTVRTATGLNWQPSTLLLTPARPVCNAREGLVPKDRRLKFGVTSGLLITSKPAVLVSLARNERTAERNGSKVNPSVVFTFTNKRQSLHQDSAGPPVLTPSFARHFECVNSLGFGSHFYNSEVRDVRPLLLGIQDSLI